MTKRKVRKLIHCREGGAKNEKTLQQCSKTRKFFFASQVCRLGKKNINAHIKNTEAINYTMRFVGNKKPLAIWQPPAYKRHAKHNKQQKYTNMLH